MAHLIAKFSNGHVADIKNSRRKYTHAWCAAYRAEDIAPGAERIFSGFSSSQGGAARNMALETRRMLPENRKFSEVVAVEVKP